MTSVFQIMSVAVLMTPIALYVGVAAYAALTREASAVALLPIMALADLANPLMKRAFRTILPPSVTKRPSGCGMVSGTKFGCGVLPNVGTCNLRKGTGFPSGHSQSVALFAAYVTGRLLRTDKKTSGQSGLDPQRCPVWVPISLCWMLVAVVAMHRILTKCHSVPQVIAGLSIGATIGWTAAAVV